MTSETYIKYELHNLGLDGKSWFRAMSAFKVTEAQAAEKFRAHIREERKRLGQLRGFLPDELCKPATKYRMVVCACNIITPDFK